MQTVSNPELRGRSLTPVNWRVREAHSPFATGWGGQWWSLLLCYEGLAAFQWPYRRYWARMFRIGLVAGAGHMSASVLGDSWPLTERPGPVHAPRALLFPREALAIEVRRSRFLWSNVLVTVGNTAPLAFAFMDPRAVEVCTRRLEGAFPGIVHRAGWKPAG